MKCAHHPDAEALRQCRVCGNALCETCAVEIKGNSYCRNCLEARLETGSSRPESTSPADFRSPRVAGWLSVLPGLGLVYLGQYLSALTVALIFMGAIHLADRSEMGGIFVPTIWFGQILYTVREARRLNRGTERQDEKESPVWGGILTGLGILFLLDQLGWIGFGEVFEKFWPVLIIILGLQILFRARRERTSSGAA